VYGGSAVYLTNPASASDLTGSDQYYVSAAPSDPSAPQPQQPLLQHQSFLMSASIGSLPQLPSSVNLSKTDSHAVLMELFARDQDLVRQATESARLKAETRSLGAGSSQAPAGASQQQQQQQQSSSTSPGGSANQAGTTQNSQQQQSQSQMPSPSLNKAPSSQGLPTVPTLNSWPHFSSINSLNNLGTIPGVKSITSLSGADLANRGNVNRMGNLAQVKSMESMGKNDSYAFLEVFFGDRSSTNLSGMGGKDGRGLLKNGGGSGGSGNGGMGGDEDNEIGLSLEDESPSHHVPTSSRKDAPMGGPSAPGQGPGMSSSASQDSMLGSGTLKRAFDDAMAARGLMSVSRSSERLTDLVLPAKIQRTLSQELMNKGTGPPQSSSFLSYAYSYASTPPPSDSATSGSQQQQYAGQQAVEPPVDYSATSSSETDGHVKVSPATACAICHQTNVDTQLRPCGHMFHERCLKPSLQTPTGQPRCPIDDVQMHCAVLAIPTEEIAASSSKIQQQQQQSSEPQASSWGAYTASAPAPSNGAS
jgi:Zinc finger, C3HC4 type (RING finger)